MFGMIFFCWSFHDKWFEVSIKKYYLFVHWYISRMSTSIFLQLEAETLDKKNLQ